MGTTSLNYTRGGPYERARYTTAHVDKSLQVRFDISVHERVSEHVHWVERVSVH